MLKDLVYDVRRFAPEPQDKPSAFSQRVRGVLRGILSPGFQAIVVYRTFRWIQTKGLPAQPARFFVERWVEMTTGISIPVDAEIGPGLRIHHFGGVILHPSTKIGKNCTLYHDTTIGADGITEDAPVLGDDVMVGTGARILGGITVGNRCRIGANAVVVRSCPDDAVMVGAPARNVRNQPCS